MHQDLLVYLNTVLSVLISLYRPARPGPGSYGQAGGAIDQVSPDYSRVVRE